MQNTDFSSVVLALEQSSYAVGEGDGINVCVEIQATQANVLECEIVATLTTTDGPKAGND